MLWRCYRIAFPLMDTVFCFLHDLPGDIVHGVAAKKEGRWCICLEVCCLNKCGFWFSFLFIPQTVLLPVLSVHLNIFLIKSSLAPLSSPRHLCRCRHCHTLSFRLLSCFTYKPNLYLLANGSHKVNTFISIHQLISLLRSLLPYLPPALQTL